MISLIVAVVLFFLFYFILRHLKIYWEEQRLPEWLKIFPLSHGMDHGCRIDCPALAATSTGDRPCSEPNYGSAILFIGHAFAATVVVKVSQAIPEVFDAASSRLL